MMECDPRFTVLLGADFAGKSTVLSQLAKSFPATRLISVDDAFTSDRHRFVTELRSGLTEQVLPALGSDYSPEFMGGLLQLAAVHLRDEVLRQEPGQPILVDSYYYKMLAKCRLAGLGEHPMLAWWRSFPQPSRVVFLDVSPQTAWWRTGSRLEVNSLEYYGEEPDRVEFENYQTDLRKLLFEETAELPVTVIEEKENVVETVHAVAEVLAA